VLFEAARLFAGGERQQAIAMAVSVRSQPDGAEPAARLLTSFRETAAGEMARARDSAVEARVPAGDLAAADGLRDRAVATADAADAVGVYAEATAAYNRLAVQIAGPDQLASLAAAAHASGDRARAIELAIKALGRSPGFAPATRLLRTIVGQAQARAADARRAAIAAGVESDASYGEAAKQAAAADRLAVDQAARAVALFDDAERLYRTAIASAVPLDELMRQAEAARQVNGGRAIDLALQVQSRDRNHAGARALLAGVLADAGAAAAAARTAALGANAGGSAAFKRAEARLVEARKIGEPRQQFAAFAEATDGFREAEKTAAPPPAPPPTPPPVDPAEKARALLATAESALNAGSVDQAERLLGDIDAELKSRGVSLPAADEARRAAVAAGIRTRRSEAARAADTAAIRAALTEYKSAYEALEVDRLLAVATFLRNRRAQLEASFREMSSQTLQLTTSEPRIDGGRATVTFSEVLTQTPRVGRTLPPSARRGEFTLVKHAATGAWTIEAMNVK
jgi:hypothetical protein